MGAKFNKEKCGVSLKQAQARLGIHRNNKLGDVAKTKDEICKALNVGNETIAKIQTETLINDEGLAPCYNVLQTMCGQVAGRLTYISK